MGEARICSTALRWCDGFDAGLDGLLRLNVMETADFMRSTHSKWMTALTPRTPVRSTYWKVSLNRFLKASVEPQTVFLRAKCGPT